MQRSLQMRATNLPNLGKISPEGSCPENGRGDNLLARGSGSKMDGTVFPGQVAVW